MCIAMLFHLNFTFLWTVNSTFTVIYIQVLSDEDVDPVRTTSNDICEIFSVSDIAFIFYAATSATWQVGGASRVARSLKVRGQGDFRQMYQQDVGNVPTNIKEKSQLTRPRAWETWNAI